MNTSLTYRTLTCADLSQMHRSFIEAFSNYQVNMKMTREAFEDRMLSKLNIRFDLSIGVFSGEKLIAFIFQTINQYEGQLAVYNGGTGVIPGYLGQNLTAKMYEFTKPKLIEEGVEKCVLEVLAENESAIRAYEKSGFEKTKSFQCLMLKSGTLKRNSEQLVQINQTENLLIDEYLSMGDVAPSMLDQLSQIKHHLPQETILEYRRNEELLGYIIFQQKNGRIAQLAVRNKYRKQGIGTALVAKTHLLSNSKTLSVLNIEDQQQGIILFFEKLGFIRDLQQFEMQKQLTDV